MSIRITSLAALVAAMLLATGSSSQATYTLTTQSVVPTAVTFNQTSFTFTAITPQTGSVASNFNVIDVGAASTSSGSDTGSVTLSSNMTLTGPTGTESFTLTGTFQLLSGNAGGIVSQYNNVAITNIVGSGYTIFYAGYAPPSPGSGTGTFTDGNISITVIPNAVPEPASVAMLGLGLIGVGGFAVRRKMAK